jgi:hypothetical protein
MLAAVSLGGATAAAQLPELVKPPLPMQLPEPQETTNQLFEPLQQVVHSPLPSPLEELVQDSPVAPVRETARGVVASPGSGLPGGNLPGGTRLDDVSSGVGGSQGGGSSSGGGNPSGSAAPGSSPAQAPPGVTSPGTANGGSGPSFRSGPRGEEARDGTRNRRDRRADRPGARTTGRHPGGDGGSADLTGSTTAPALDATAADRRTASREAAPAEEDDGPLRTVNRIVQVVPDAVWIALGLLSLLALAFFARSHVDRRRARTLRRERERLLRDMGLLERVLLPRVPERMGALAVSVAYRPAAGPAAGGDFYDVFELSDGRVGLFVGDVSGHGREALDCTSTLRPALRGHLEAGLSPRAALGSAGRAAGIDPSGRFTTAVVAVHDPSSGTLTYAAAGHPPPVLVGPGAHEPVIVAAAPPIGVGLRTGMRQTTVPLPRGSSACFVTDGLLEARANETLLGHEWLERVVAAFGPLDSAEVLLDRVFEASDQASDDMTACLVRAVDGPTTAGPRIEELELAPDDVGAPAPGRFLEACGVPAEAVEDVLVDARRLTVEAGKALLTVTIEAGTASVAVTAPTRDALATT